MAEVERMVFIGEMEMTKVQITGKCEVGSTTKQHHQQKVQRGRPMQP